MAKRIAVIDKDLCKPKKCNYQCMKVCPKNRAGEECIVTDENTFPRIDEKICIGCGLCIKACERAGFKALSIVNLPKELEELPIHRFGPNDFALFRLPFPSPGKIVGLVGPNGTGKTTALRILAGEIKPNLGIFGSEADFSNLIKIFRGTELQSYLEQMKENKIKISYKPQRVDQIPKFYSGKVSRLMEKIDERKILNEILEKTNLEKIVEKEVKELSGGELQRVAIISCILRDADIFYFDEPTSFLDVFQRLNMAKLIKEYTSQKSVMVVDHDLATLDFLADRIHIFYGVPGVYGIVSKPYSTRVGINIFLDGYIKEDNVRFREEPITFFSSISERGISQEVLASFENIQKRLGSFTLEIERGDLRKKEVLAILGANALGKTTFAKILAGEIKPDKGKLSSSVKISYKPQYIEISFEGLVREYLASVAEIEKEEYKAEIIKPLGLEKLLEKKLKELSGGELQRVAIAYCLSKNADLYLLDEPSAFLDVEQRLALAKLLNKLVDVKEKTCIVIDHDLLFLSQVGSRAMVFLGEPGTKGYAEEVKKIKDSFNLFLKNVGITFRKDPQTGRPRANKLNSQLDLEQKEREEYWKV
ncbi:MAG: ribosome biogenesis/translation initiation ATPase RLI [Candidatus Aenigmatarchaeota archaeon]